MNSQSVIKELEKNLNLSKKNMSTYWAKQFDKKWNEDHSMLERDYRDIYAPLGCGYIKKHFIKKFLHLFFQIIVYGYRIFFTKTFRKYKKVFDTVNRQINEDTMRHIFTFELLKKKINPKKICIIGDGKINGLLGAHLTFPDAKIYSCNLTEMLINENLILNRTELPLKNLIKVVGAIDEIDDDSYKLFLIPSNLKKFLLNKKIDLFINIASFQEMTYSEVNNYFSIIKNNKSTLYCCNREHKKLSDLETHFSKEQLEEELYFDKYPWDNCTKIFYEDCPWHQRLYTLRYPFIMKLDGNIKHCLVQYLK